MAKGIIDVIKYEGDNKTFIYKYPAEDFNFGTQLIVHQSQEAVLFQDGKALQSFQAGAYTLDTKNYPILRNALSALAGGKALFHAEVYFINLTTQLGIKWGTDSKVRLFDPLSGLHLELGASGTFNLKVNDGRKLLIKVVGTFGRIQAGGDLRVSRLSSGFLFECFPRDDCFKSEISTRAYDSRGENQHP